MLLNHSGRQGKPGALPVADLFAVLVKTWSPGVRAYFRQKLSMVSSDPNLSSDPKGLATTVTAMERFSPRDLATVTRCRGRD